MDTPPVDSSAVIELRQYTLKPGRRDDLIELFDSTFIEPQEAAGMRVLGQFRDRGDPQRFVWLRGFDDMPSRAAALQAFYGGPVWQAHRDRANDTMLDSDNVMLLRPVAGDSGLPQSSRPPLKPADAPNPVPPRKSSVVLATLYLLSNPVNAEFRHFFDHQVSPLLARTGATPLARYETETAANNFPRLPVRTGENAYVWLTTFPDQAALREHRATLAAIPSWREEVSPALQRQLASPPQEWVLEPTDRSRFGHAAPFEFRPERTGSRQDFDFIAGDWNVVNHRLKQRGMGSDDWETFPATHRGALHLGGIANVDEMTLPGGQGMSVRSFDLARRQWSIYWISSRDGLMQPPVRGGFTGNRGEFFGEDLDGGRPVKVRFTWTVKDPRHARWEQAFSYDDATWETNWIMEFTRAAGSDAASRR
jgi:hypothetical protein